jgi:hypothetical protein
LTISCYRWPLPQESNEPSRSVASSIVLAFCVGGQTLDGRNADEVAEFDEVGAASRGFARIANHWKPKLPRGGDYEFAQRFEDQRVNKKAGRKGGPTIVDGRPAPVQLAKRNRSCAYPTDVGKITYSQLSVVG